MFVAVDDAVHPGRGHRSRAHFGHGEVRASSDGCCQAARYADTTNCNSQLVLRDSWWLGDAKALLCDITGFMLTVVQFMLSLLGACAYNADETIYPELDEAQDIPPDALALLDMNGIDVTRWKRLQHLQYGYDA